MGVDEILRLLNLGVDGLLLAALVAGSRGTWIYGKSHQEAMTSCQTALKSKDQQITDLRKDKDQQIADLREREKYLLSLLLKSTEVSQKATTQADRAIRIAENRAPQ